MFITFITTKYITILYSNKFHALRCIHDSCYVSFHYHTLYHIYPVFFYFSCTFLFLDGHATNDACTCTSCPRILPLHGTRTTRTRWMSCSTWMFCELRPTMQFVVLSTIHGNAGETFIHTILVNFDDCI